MNAPTAFPDPKPVPPYKHTPLFPLGADTTPYKKVTTEGVRVEKVLGRDMLVVSRDALKALSEAAFGDINHYLRPGHLQQLRNILDDSEASPNDKFVAFDFLKNANIAAGGVLPMCQDTGTAIIMGKKGCNVITDGDDEAALSEGARDAYLRRNLRYSQVAPLTMYEEKNTANNMPAQCEIYAEGDDAYKFMFMAKGGGSANKSFLFQATPSVLTKDRLLAFLKEKIMTLGTAACPPYHLAIVIGGTSAELCMKTVKLASARYLDALPTQGSPDGNAFRDLEMEQEILKMTQSSGVGAQFGGKYFCHDVRVIRLPRHGASLPIGLGVSCSADRQVLGKITKDGVYLEELEHNPAQYLPQVEQALGGEVVKIDLNQPMKDILATLSNYPTKTRLSLTGTMIVARDSAHAKLRDRLEKGEPLPDYFKNHPVYYAGPAKTPEGYASGAFGPTTAGRMDSFVDQFQAAGGSMVMVAKGNRAVAVREACKKHGGFYLGSIGGSAANLAEHCIKKVEVVEYPELGMEAIWRIDVVDFPAFIIIDDKGNDFFKELNLG
ncbi:fumarate hydratase [Tardiphaga sp. 866_E4_N2_1]|jgi:fumarate hydratase class I|uniref:fumarate hydratase n=1 Tax=Nitrobacteraceae TaxID=41294 RepID=UPI0008A7EC5C|nr:MULTISPECIES: fumarate hydratase [Nitrobacteraceae]MDR6662774.1 fumarate hydratase class I [Tardiphaga robiniae]NUU41034.1 fumarate hydratase [Tardiphaga robiniae]UFS76889.1 fumarate hydratase [Tardiphaga sp. 37S4]WPO40746.1 fumarate hydratase [Tardiphaga sp. 42S5]SEH45012.1 fumarase, class I, homodimeric [Tardiphaga sp. OK245]